MVKLISKNNLKIITLALGLLWNINNVKATDYEIFQSAIFDVIQFNETGDCCSYDSITCENIEGVNSITTM